MQITQAVILAGGRGERMQPLTDTIPKPMAPILGRPFLEHLLLLLKRNGITDVVILVGYLHEKITEHFGDGSRFGINIRYSIGNSDDETGTRVRNARDLLDERFLLLYGDNFAPINLAHMADFFKEKGALAITTVYSNTDGGGEYGFENNIALAPDGLVLAYDKTRKNKDLNGVDIGFFILDKKIIDRMPVNNFSFEKEILPLLAKEKNIYGYRTEHPYYTLTSIAMIPKMEKFLRPQNTLFLDRDGVINVPTASGEYVTKPEEFKFLPGAIEAMRMLSEKKYDIFIITNQRGIALGRMTEANLHSVHEYMKAELATHGVFLKGIYYCPHDYNQCECRKPKPGMFFQAAREHSLDLTRATFIGDYITDYEAGIAAGCRTILLQKNETLLDAVSRYIFTNSDTVKV